MKKNIVLISLVSAFLTACSGGGGGWTNQPNPGTPTSGVLVDSPVGGMSYRTDSQSGITDDNGSYKCYSGETVQFFLLGDDNKEVVLGSVPCRKVISPIDIVTNGQLNITADIDLDLTAQQKSDTLRLLRLLQSLSVSSNNTVMLSISRSETNKLITHLENSGKTVKTGLAEILTSADFDAELSATMSAMGRPSHVVSEATARAHFENQKVGCNANGCSTVGGDGEPQQPPTNPTPPPQQPASEKCIEGLTYAPMNWPNGVTAAYPINLKSGELLADYSNVEIVSTLIQLKADGSVVVYRVKKDSQYFQMNGGSWQANANGRMTVSNVVFANAAVSFDFGAPSVDEYANETRNVVGDSIGNAMSSFNRIWRTKKSCYIPTQVTVVVGPADL